MSCHVHQIVSYIHLIILGEFVFFKQKTAYEMRISDWSSDVCSSDLTAAEAPFAKGDAAVFFVHPTSYYSRSSWNAPLEDRDSDHRANLFVQGMASAFADAGEIRSDEHTSELQSLMRISYDVFCLQHTTPISNDRANKISHLRRLLN